MGNVFRRGLLAFAFGACGSSEQPPIFPPGGDAPPRPDAPMVDAGEDPIDGDVSDGDVPDPDGGGGSGQGPAITLISPEPGTLIAGEVLIQVDAVDTEGVELVTATVAGTNEVVLTSQGGARFAATFDTTPLAGLVAPTIIVRARDFAGEENELGFVITLDNEPPIAELDPPRVRTTRLQSGVLQCSFDFDAVGNDAPNDGESVGQLSELRARITDLGNTGTISSTLFIPVAGVERADLYVFDDTTKPLVVDSNGDGICDDINPNIVPTTTPSAANEAAVIALQAITPTGTGFFQSDVFGGANASCGSGTDTQEPPPICAGELATTKVIRTFDSRPQIFGIPPSTGGNCLGFAFDARASNVSDGPACVAILVVDALGNRSVSVPLRVCINSSGTASNCPAIGQLMPANTRPNCTGRVAGGVVNNTPCTPRAYVRGVADEFELVPE